jgi:hypothetical protein
MLSKDFFDALKIENRSDIFEEKSYYFSTKK